MWRSAHFRHSILNLGGAAVPVLVGLPCLGILARTLGTEQFSLMMLTLALVGYAGVLDLGLSRAVTAVVAGQDGDAQGRARTLATALIVVTLLGVVGSGLLMLFAEPLVVGLLRVEPPLRAGAVLAFQLTALTIVPLLVYLVIQGYLDGVQDFREANIQRILSGSLPMISATVAVLISPMVAVAMGGFLLGRILCLLLIIPRTAALSVAIRARPDWPTVRRLAGFGGWVTVSSTVGPLMGYLDRFILAAVRSPAVVGFYAAPAEAVYRLLVLPTAINRSLFPKLASAGSSAERREYLRQTNIMILAACVPPALLILVAAPLILRLWLGEAFVSGSADAFRILAVGFLFGALAQVPLIRLLSIGRPDLPAKLHLLQLLPFLALSYYLGLTFGAAGAAAAWWIRNLADVLLLNLMAARYAPR
jgi:O-antigen/teichoic acid export membrane protein